MGVRNLRFSFESFPLSVGVLLPSLVPSSSGKRGFSKVPGLRGWWRLEGLLGEETLVEVRTGGEEGGLKSNFQEVQQ